MSAPAAPIKTPPPPETGTNKIGGMTSGKQSPFASFLNLKPSGSNLMGGGAKDPYSYDLKAKPVPPPRSIFESI